MSEIDGWGWPLLSPRAHYFVSGLSLCEQWGFTGEPCYRQEFAPRPGPDDCVECHRLMLESKKPDWANTPSAAQVAP